MLDTYDLNHNPFFDKTDHVLVGENRKIQLRNIKNDILEAVNSQSQYLIVIKGTVGIGKSFGLEYLQKQTLDSENFDGKKLLCLKFDATPGVSPSKYVQSICTSIFDKLGKEKILELHNELKQLAETQQTTIPELLNKTTTDFKNAINNLDTESDLIFSWLSGQKTDLTKLKKLEITNKIDNISFALKIINDFLRLLRMLDYSGLVLCIDEVEEIAIGGSSKSIPVLTNFKKIWEENKNNLSSESKEDFLPIIFVLGFTPETWELLSGDSLLEGERSKTGGAGLETFLSRVGPQYELESFTTVDTKTFIGIILDKARDSPNGSIEPFTDDAVEYIRSVSSGVPRAIIDYCNTLLKVGNSEKIKPLNKEKCIEILVESGEIPSTETSEFVEEP